MEQALAHAGNSLVCIASTHCENGANVQVQQLEPRSEVPKLVGRFVQQTVGLVEVPGRRCDPCHAAQRIADVPGPRPALARREASGKPIACRRFVANRMLDVTQDELRLGQPVRGSLAVLEREAPLQCPACAIELPLHVLQ